MRWVRAVAYLLGSACLVLLVLGVCFSVGMVISLEGWDVAKVVAPCTLVSWIMCLCIESWVLEDKDKKPVVECLLDDNVYSVEDGILSLKEDCVVGRDDRACVVDTGVKMIIPKGFIGLIRPCDDTLEKYPISCNGIVHPDQEGTVKLNIRFRGRHEMVIIEKGTKIAKVCIVPSQEVEYANV